jgi:uncharacterized NAD(P)/FAD-binding protein YdhS
LQLERDPLKKPVNIHIIEKSGNFGGGGIHSTSQPPYLLLNTIGSQITAFGDDDSQARASNARKTLHGHLVDRGVRIGPNDYPSRAQHGRYLADMFTWAEDNKPNGVAIHRRKALGVDIVAGTQSVYDVVLDQGASVPAHEILLLTGHAKNRVVPGSSAEQWADYASSRKGRSPRLSYLHYVYPIDRKTAYIEPGDTVYVIGMGLTAIDIIKTFTIGRGGRFEAGRYLASGREPLIILGSRLGLPYSARAHNQKTGQYKGRIFIPEVVAELKAQKSKIDFVEDLLPLIIREMELVYYSTMLGASFGERYLGCASGPDRRKLIDQNVPIEKRFAWLSLENPFWRIESQTPAGRPWFSSLESYTDFVVEYLRADIAEAEAGNLTSPLKTAVDAVLRDLRDTLRMAVDLGGLTARSHRYLDRDFNRINNRIAVGPPVSSTKELLMLAQAGIVSFSGPQPKLDIDRPNGVFTLASEQVAGSKRFVQHILNGRIHSVDCENDTSPLIRSLMQKRMIRTFVNEDETGRYNLGGLDVTEDFKVINADGHVTPNICALGIPIEGKFWFNAADARPDVNSNAIGQLSRWSASVVAGLRARETA